MLNNKKNAFTMIELVFVIVILGILASIAIPKYAATRTDAEIAKARSDIAAIRSAIVSERQARLIKGESSWVTKLDDGTGNYFVGPDANHTLLMYGVAPGKWSRVNNTTYKYSVGGVAVQFTYDNTNGKFTCDTANATYGDMCKNLIN